MKGHKAENCVPTQLPATPPSSPPNATAGARTRTRNDIEIAVTQHWRDPSWTPRVTLASPPVPSSGSLIPTVLVDEDGHTIWGSRAPASDAGSADDASVSGLEAPSTRPLRAKTPMAQALDQAHALRLCEPVLSIVAVRLGDLPRMQATAGQSGLCTSIVRAPWTAPRFKDEFGSDTDGEDRKTAWVVVGGDATLVQRTADLQQQYERVPGAIKDDIVVVQATYKHIFLASAVSALVVVAAMSILL